jgi:transposase
MTCPVTVSSVLRTFGRAVTKRPKGVTPVTTIGNGGRCNESSGAASEVVLGVDTHLDVHLAVALDHLGRRLGTFSVPTTKNGYESLLAWAEGFGPLRCAGVEGTSSYGAGLARHLRAMAIPVMEIQRPRSALTSGAKASLTLSMPRSPLGRCWPARRRACPRAQTGAWR